MKDIQVMQEILEIQSNIGEYNIGALCCSRDCVQEYVMDIRAVDTM